MSLNQRELYGELRSVLQQRSHEALERAEQLLKELAHEQQRAEAIFYVLDIIAPWGAQWTSALPGVLAGPWAQRRRAELWGFMEQGAEDEDGELAWDAMREWIGLAPRLEVLSEDLREFYELMRAFELFEGYEQERARCMLLVQERLERDMPAPYESQEPDPAVSQAWCWLFENAADYPPRMWDAGMFFLVRAVATDPLDDGLLAAYIDLLDAADYPEAFMELEDIAPRLEPERAMLFRLLGLVCSHLSCRVYGDEYMPSVHQHARRLRDGHGATPEDWARMLDWLRAQGIGLYVEEAPGQFERWCEA